MGHLRLPHREARGSRIRRNVLKRGTGGRALKSQRRDKTRDDDKMGNTEEVQAAHTE